MMSQLSPTNHSASCIRPSWRSPAKPPSATGLPATERCRRALSFALATRMGRDYIVAAVTVTTTTRRFSILSDGPVKQEHMSIQTKTHKHSRWLHTDVILAKIWSPVGLQGALSSGTVFFFFHLAWSDALFRVLFDVGLLLSATGWVSERRPENVVDVRSTCMPFWLSLFLFLSLILQGLVSLVRVARFFSRYSACIMGNRWQISVRLFFFFLVCKSYWLPEYFSRVSAQRCPFIVLDNWFKGKLLTKKWIRKCPNTLQSKAFCVVTTKDFEKNAKR